MKKVLTVTELLLIATLSWSGEPYWDGFYDMTQSLEEAKATPLSSNDAAVLKKAGVYFFSLVNGSNGMKIDTRNKDENGKAAMEYLEAAAMLDKSNPILSTWRAASTLAYAGATKKLSSKIKYANEGISLFNSVPSDERNNLDYLFMRIVSFSGVPKSFKNLMPNIKIDAKKFYKLFQTLDNKPELYTSFRESIKTLEAWAYYQTSDKNKAKEIMLTVNEEHLLRAQAEDTPTAEKYFKMKKKLKIR